MKKRQLALAFLAFVALLVAATIAVLRTRWAGERLCAVAAERVRSATGLPLAFDACRIDPLRLAVEVDGVRVGPADAPAFTAETLSARLSPVQPLGRTLHLDAVRLVHPRLAVRLAGGGGGGCSAAALSRIDVRQLEIEGGALDLSGPGWRVLAPSVDVRSATPPRRGPLPALAAAFRRARLDVSAGPVNVEAGGRTLALDHAGASVDLALDLSSAEIRSVSAEGEGVHAAARGTLTDLCSPRVDGRAVLAGPIAALLGAAGRPDKAWRGTAEVEVRASGPLGAPALAGAIRLSDARYGPFVAGDARADVRLDGDRLVVERLEVPAQGGAVRARGTIRLARGLPLDGELALDGVDLAEVLARVGVRGSWATVRFDGSARIAGTLSPIALSGTLGAEARGLAVYGRAAEAAAGVDPPVLEARRVRVDAPFRVDRAGLAFDRGRFAAGAGVLDADVAVGFSAAAGFHVHGAGEVDLGALGPLAGIPWSGMAHVDLAVGAAPYANPRVDGRVRVDGFRFLRIALGAASADVSYGPDTLLRLRDVEGARGGTRYEGDATVDLAARPVRVVSSRFDARGRLRDVFDAIADWMPRSRWAREAWDGDVELAATAHGPAAALDAEWQARLGAGTLYGRAYDSGRGEGTIADGDVTFFDRAELRRGGGVARARGTWGGTPPFPWDLEVSWAGLPLADAGLPGGPWTGTASGTATLHGSWGQPSVRFAANGEGVSVDRVPLGTVQAGGSLDAGRLTVTGTAEGASFSGEARLDGRMPFRAAADVALDDAARLLPGAAGSGLRARVEGHADAEGELADLPGARAQLRVDRLALDYGDLRVENAAPVAISWTRGRVDVPPVLLRGANTELALSGSRSAAGDLDFSASGSADLRLLAGATPTLRRQHGLLRLEAHVGGTVDDPVLLGTGRVEDAGFELRGGTATFSSLHGDLVFSQNRIMLRGLEGALNGGRLVLRGEVELAKLLPRRIRLEGELEEVPLAIPASLPMTLSGRIEADGKPDAATLTGRVHVVRARYVQDVDLEKRLLEVRRRAVAPPSYDPAGEWLRLDLQLVVDGDARVDNDLVRGGVRGELLVTGTLAAPALVGSLSMTEGSRATFRGNEFDLKQAVATFTADRGAEVALDVHGEAQVRDYLIYMHLFNTLDDPKLQLTSSPALSQPDIITLLSLGFTTRDAAPGAGVGGAATAAAAQALFSASGLDEQVRRFLPRDGLVQDVAVRLTSAYSPANGQIEPRAELESWLWHDRLRLRYQAPLSGARGQRAQAELRLGGHTAVEYQWDNDNPDVAATGDHGVDLKLRWEWSE